MSDDRREPSDEDLLELLLAGEAGAEERARAEADPRTRARLTEHAAFLDRCRSLLASAPDAAAGRLAERVLARTTRQDPGLRGDLAVVLRFVRDRLGVSPALRVAAAILLVQVFALPVLAWMIWRAPERTFGFLTQVEPPPVEPFLPVVPQEPLDELVLDPEEPEVGLVEAGVGRARAPRPAPFAAERRARSEAESLRSAGWPELDDPTGGAASALLTARARLAAGSDSLADLPDPRGGLERALRVELLLDRHALEGRVPGDLEAALAALGAGPEEPRAVRRLEGLALERARAHGLLDQVAWSRLQEHARPGARSGDPLDAAWRGALGEALRAVPDGAGLLGDPALSAWIAAPRESR